MKQDRGTSLGGREIRPSEKLAELEQIRRRSRPRSRLLAAATVASLALPALLPMLRPHRRSELEHESLSRLALWSSC
jgi:hypothetical protein